MHTCKNCYGGLRFDPEKQKLVCDFCGSEFETEEVQGEETIQAEEQNLTPEETAFFQAYLMTCPQCGGELLTTEETAATFCSYCGSSVLLQSRMAKGKRPSYIIPFAKSKEDCEQAYRKALKKAVFAPANMRYEEQIERFRGIYMPYWVYSFENKGPIMIRGTKDYRKGDYIYTKHYNLRCDANAFYNGIAYDASSSFSDNLSQAIAPFDFHEAKPFDPAYLSGFYADTSDVPAEVYEADAKDIAREHVAGELTRNHVYRDFGLTFEGVRDSVYLKEKPHKLAMYPVWFLATRNKKGDRVSYAVVNGQTGEVAADLPIDIKKLLLGTLALAVPIFLLLAFLFTLTPGKALGITLLFGLVSLILANRQLNLAYCAEHKLDDRGYIAQTDPWEAMTGRRQNIKSRVGSPAGQRALKKISLYLIWFAVMVSIGAVQQFHSGAVLCVIWFLVVATALIPGKIKINGVKKKVAAAPIRDRMKTLWKPIAAMVFVIAVLVVHPVFDVYYYVCAMASIALVAWSFLDIIHAYNTISTRPLPQFGRRGGDENGEH